MDLFKTLYTLSLSIDIIRQNMNNKTGFYNNTKEVNGEEIAGHLETWHL